MSAKAATASAPHLQLQRWPRTVIARFVARRTIRSATFVALAFGLFCASKIIGYIKVYPTAAERISAAALLTSNIGFKALFGTPHQVETAAGYGSWYGVTLGVVLGGIWAYLVATRTFRGEEAAGRWELMLAGLTTPRRAAANVLAGLGVGLALFYVLVALALIAIGKAHGVGYSAGAALYFALAATASAIMFTAVGAFVSQLMPTRALAAGLATAIFGISYLVRAAGDITSAHWLVNISPLGWVELLRPLVGPQPIWLIPIALFTLALVSATIWLAGRHDLGASIVADRDSAPPRLFLLRGPLTSAVRFTRGATLSWLAGMAAYLAFFGALTGSAAQLLGTASASTREILDKLSKTQEVGARSFLGIAFFIFMLIIMAYVASAVASMRSDEANGYLDNFLVRPVSRQYWLWSRLSLIVTTLLAAAILAATAIWLVLGSNHYGITFHDLVSAGLNALPAAVFTLGVAVLAFGVLPRFTSVIAYGVIVWSFIVQLLSSGTNLSHWLLDTSIFTHVAFAPATDPKWSAGWILILLGVLIASIGAFVFNRRDLASE